MARYAETGGGVHAVIEMAACSGLRLVPHPRRNPLRTSTRGTGEAMLAAARRGARTLAIGVGGSATVDGGIGAAAALGWRFLDRRGRELEPCGGALSRIARVAPPSDHPLARVGTVVICDVRNALLGPLGAAPCFAPQKGATPAQVAQLADGLANLAAVVQGDLGIDIAALRGGGASGGLAAGLAAFCGAGLVDGGRHVVDEVGLPEALSGASWLVTGEGRLDEQSLMGKAAFAALQAARRAGARVIGVAGSLSAEARLRRAGFEALFALAGGPTTLEDSMATAEPRLREVGRSIGALLRASNDG